MICAKMHIIMLRKRKVMMSKEERCKAFADQTDPPVPSSYKGNTLQDFYTIF